MIHCKLATRKVHIGGVYLDPARSQKLYNHSPDGFAWGYAGSGPAQLALAILLHFTNDATFSLGHYQQFKFDVIMGWNQYGDVHLPNKVATEWIDKHGGVVAAKLGKELGV
jgi:hypothetical protein